MTFKKVCLGFWLFCLGLFYFGVSSVWALDDNGYVENNNDYDRNDSGYVEGNSDYNRNDNGYLEDNCYDEKNFVNIYLFYSDTCKHCEAERELLKELKEKYENIYIYEYEVTDDENASLLEEVAKIKGTTVTGVPFTIIGDKIYKGYSSSKSKPRFMGAIEYYLEYGYVDKVGEYIGGILLPEYFNTENRVSIDEYINEYINYEIDFPLIGKVDTRNKMDTVVALLAGFSHGIKGYAVLEWVFLLGIFFSGISKEDKIKIGGINLFVVGFMQIIFMMIETGLGNLRLSMKGVKILTGIIIIGLGVFMGVTYFWKDKHKTKILMNDESNLSSKKKLSFKKVSIVFGIGLLCLMVSFLKINLAWATTQTFLEYLFKNNLTFSMRLTDTILYVASGMFVDLVIFFIGVKVLKREKLTFLK